LAVATVCHMSTLRSWYLCPPHPSRLLGAHSVNSLLYPSLAQPLSYIYQYKAIIFHAPPPSRDCKDTGQFLITTVCQHTVWGLVQVYLPQITLNY
jgi:hypothetical protein